MPKIALPWPTSDAVIRGEGRGAFRADAWDDEKEPPVRRLSRAEAADLATRQPAISPWRVVAYQVLVGLVIAVLVLLATGDRLLTASAASCTSFTLLPSAPRS